MAKLKILFFHFDLKGGGAEKVLVNLVNNLDQEKYDITVQTVFGVGPHVANLKPHINYKYIFKRQFRGFSKIQKLFSPRFLHKLFIREKYDVEIAYLETCPTRIISGCPHKETKKMAWIHITLERFGWFRNMRELEKCYRSFDKVVSVSSEVQNTFIQNTGLKNLPYCVQRNVIEADVIQKKGEEKIDIVLAKDKVNLCYVGRLIPNKDPLRLLESLLDLKCKDITNWHLYILGIGELEGKIKEFIKSNKIEQYVTMLGYQQNPYKFVSKMDLYVCSSHAEGYSTSTTEAILLHTPVFTTDCGGMKEILDYGKYGYIVEDNDKDFIEGLERIITNNDLLQYYYEKAVERSSFFKTSVIVKENEDLIDNL